MALTIEIIPPTMTVDGHTKDEDYECATFNTRQDFWFFIDQEARKLSDEAESHFTHWIHSTEVSRMVKEFLLVPTGYGSISFILPDRRNRGFTYILTGTRIKKHTAIASFK